jgi:hypothetical protein
MAQCAITFCEEDGDLLPLCSSNHHAHVACIKRMVNTSLEGENDGVTTTDLRCPLCRESTTLHAWRDIFRLSPRERETIKELADRVVSRRHIMERITRRGAVYGVTVARRYRRPTD